jgi:hypothetical protein
MVFSKQLAVALLFSMRAAICRRCSIRLPVSSNKGLPLCFPAIWVIQLTHLVQLKVLDFAVLQSLFIRSFGLM